MARPIPFPEANDVAESLTRPNVGGLPNLEHEKSATSCWQLGPDELAEIARTGVIWVTNDTIGAETGPPPEGKRWQPALRVTAFKAIALQGW